MNNNKTYRLKGFTIAELLVVLALTSISITLSYGTLNYVQQLFSEYKKQHRFLNEFADLKRRLDFESLTAELVSDEGNNVFLIRRDSILSKLEIKESYVLLSRNNQCDTFHFAPKNITTKYELMQNPQWTNKIVNTLMFNVEFKKQNYVFCFYRDYTAATKLKLDLEYVNGNN